MQGERNDFLGLTFDPATLTYRMFSATQMQQHGLWCQVNSASNAGMGSNIGDMFYPTGNGPDDFTLVTPAVA